MHRTRRFALSFSGALLACLFLAPPPAAAQTLSGRVVSVMDGEPVAGAVVRIAGTERSVVTDSLGAFAFADAGPGTVELRVRHAAYHELRRTVEVPPDGLTAVLPLAPRVVSLEAIEVRGRPADEIRVLARASGQSLYLDDDDLDRLRSRGMTEVAQALQWRSGARIKVLERHSAVCVRSLRTARPGAALNPDTMSAEGSGCATVFVDGVALTGPIGPSYLRALPLDAVHSIEYLGPRDASFRYGAAGSAGALLVTTRRGAERARERLLTEGARERIRHQAHLVVGGSVGLLAALGVAYQQGFFEKEGGVYMEDMLRSFATVGLGVLAGELVYRLRR